MKDLVMGCPISAMRFTMIWASVEDLVNEDTAAIMLESDPGESGVRPAEAAFVKDLADFANKRGFADCR